jgi:hypothetical protein
LSSYLLQSLDLPQGLIGDAILQPPQGHLLEGNDLTSLQERAQTLPVERRRKGEREEREKRETGTVTHTLHLPFPLVGRDGESLRKRRDAILQRAREPVWDYPGTQWYRAG